MGDLDMIPMRAGNQRKKSRASGKCAMAHYAMYSMM